VLQSWAFEERILELVKDTDTVFIFVSKHDEVDTKPLIQRLLDRQNQVVVPVVVGGLIIPSKITTLQTLNPGRFGIPEPRHFQPVTVSDIDIFGSVNK